MAIPEFHTLAELSLAHSIKKATLVARVRTRGIPHRKVGNTITIDPKHVAELLKSGIRETPLRDEKLYRKWGRYKRMGGMARKWELSFDAFKECMNALDNAGQGSLKRIDDSKPCVVGNMHWA